MTQKIDGTYCPLCGEIGLFEATLGNALVRYCAGHNGQLTPETTHTRVVVREIEEPPAARTRGRRPTAEEAEMEE